MRKLFKRNKRRNKKLNKCCKVCSSNSSELQHLNGTRSSAFKCRNKNIGKTKNKDSLWRDKFYGAIELRLFFPMFILALTNLWFVYTSNDHKSMYDPQHHCGNFFRKMNTLTRYVIVLNNNNNNNKSFSISCLVLLILSSLRFGVCVRMYGYCEFLLGLNVSLFHLHTYSHTRPKDTHKFGWNQEKWWTFKVSVEI